MRTIIVAALGAFGGTLGYAYILNAPKNTILPASFIGLAGYMAYVLLGMAGFGTMSAYFLSTVLVSVVCELLARKMRTPATIFLLSALVPLVPGYNFYLAMLALVENRGAAVAGESQHLAGVAVKHALELLAAADGPVHGVGLDAQDLLDVLHQLKGIAGFAVHLIDEGEDGDVTQGADLEQLDGLGLNALCRVDDHDSGVRCHQGTVGILREVLMARGIQNVHALACIVELQDRGSDRNTTLLLDIHPVGHSVLGALLALDGTGLIDGSTVQQQLFGQGRFAGIGVADDRKRPAALDLFTICHILISPESEWLFIRSISRYIGDSP